jgi:hypothetical protein
MKNKKRKEKEEFFMTFKEFLETRPEDVEKAKACKNLDEFKKMADGFGISYKGDSELQQAYDFIKNSQDHLSDDDLNNVAGGAARLHRKGNAFHNKETGETLTLDSGTKV